MNCVIAKLCCEKNAKFTQLQVEHQEELITWTMPTRMKSVIYRAAKYCGLYPVLRKLRMGPIVLFYHGVEESIVDSRVQTLHIQLDLFEKHIAYLRNNFEIISINDLYECLSTGSMLYPSQVVITFDDGYKNNRSIVAPYLDSLELPYTVFVSTRHISEGLRFPTYLLRASIFYSEKKSVNILNEQIDISTDAAQLSALNYVSRILKESPKKISDQIVAELTELISHDHWLELNHRFSSDEPMTWSDVKELRGRGAVIGSHCHDHFILHDKQSMEDINCELSISRDLIKEHVGECKFIAYPNGGIDDIFIDAVETVKANRYLAGFSTVAGEIEADSNPYILPRIGADTSDFLNFEFSINTCMRHNKRYRDWSRNCIEDR